MGRILFLADLLTSRELQRSAEPPLGAILFNKAPSRGSALRFMGRRDRALSGRLNIQALTLLPAELMTGSGTVFRSSSSAAAGKVSPVAWRRVP